MSDEPLLEEVRPHWSHPADVATYVRHVRRAKLRVGRPKVSSTVSGSAKWHVKFDGLYVVPRMTAGARHLVSVWEFTRSFHRRNTGETVLKVPMAGLLNSKVSAAMSESPELVSVVHREVGPELDQLDRELRAAHSKFLEEARSVLDAYLRSPERIRTNVGTLAKRLSRRPGFRSMDPDLLARIVSMNRDDLRELVDVSHDVHGPVGREEVLEAFGILDARRVLDT